MNRIFHFLLLFHFALSVSAQEIIVRINDEKSYFLENNDTILVYQSANKSSEGEYERSNYIHPLYALNGEKLTEDFPTDHLHHRGIFWAWHQLYIGERRIGDGWEIKDFSWDVVSVKELKEGNGVNSIRSEVFWKSPLWMDNNGSKKPFVKEITSLKVYPLTDKYRQIDIKISLLALEKKIRIGGSEDSKGYGGFSPRIKLSDDVKFENDFGEIQPQNLPVRSSSWMNITASLDSGEKFGFIILAHPDNPAYPNHWILRKKASMQNAVYPYPGATPVPLSNIEPTVLQYRLIVHEGNISSKTIDEILHHFSKS